MQVLFLSLLDFDSFQERNIYTDLLREFIKNGHDVYCISPTERKSGIKTHFEENGHLLKLRIGNTQKTNIIEKGISTLVIESQLIAAIKKHFSHIRFDLVLYATPPITFAGAVEYVKKRDGAKTYLLLKDIFPQNAVDLGMMQTTGMKSLIYKYFRKKEKQLYALSDRIGCMSQANVAYVLQHNPEIPKDKVEVCPNCIDICAVRLSAQERNDMRDYYGIPQDKKVFVYGGNLGKPQDIPYIIKCLKACAKTENAYFVIAGSGTERHLLEAYMEREHPSHIKLFDQLPKSEYERMIACCDVGMIFLDHRFTIPNFPSRLLAYMQAGLPVLACTDTSTDIGNIIVENKFGWWCESEDVADFQTEVTEALHSDLKIMGENGLVYLNSAFTAEQSCAIICRSVLTLRSDSI
jgi:glycosyltransferase involved in cell wall biosynthesis